MGGSVTASTTRSNPLNRLPLTKKTGSLSAQTDPEEGRLIAREKQLAALVAFAYRQIPKRAIYDAIETRDYQAYALQVISALELWVDDFQEVILEQLNEAGEFLAAKLASQLTSSVATVKKAETSGQSAIVGFTFDKTSTTATNYARTSAGQMVTNMASSQVQAVREAVTTAYTVGRTPTTLTKDLVAVLQQARPTTDAAKSVAEHLGTNMNGLTVRYEQAVFNRSAQIATDLANRGITGTKALEKLQKDTQAYADRLRKSRASTIARTELIRANNQGRLESMFQAERQGLINSDTARKQWVTGRFDVCQICQTLNGETQKLRDDFSRGVMTPPAHPNCRCSINLLTNVETSKPPQAAGTGQPNDPFRTTEPTTTTIGQELSERPLPGGQPSAPKPAAEPVRRPAPKPAAKLPKPNPAAERAEELRQEINARIKELKPKLREIEENEKILTRYNNRTYDATARSASRRIGEITSEIKPEVAELDELAIERFKILYEPSRPIDLDAQRWANITLEGSSDIIDQKTFKVTTIAPHPEQETAKWQKYRERWVVADKPTLELNQAMRGEIEFTPGLKSRLREAKFLTEPTTTQDFIVSRATELTPSAAAKLVPGELWTSKSFVATQGGRASPYFGLRLSPGRIKVKMEIRVPKGTHVGSVFHGENILRPGDFKIISSELIDGVLNVVMEAIP